MSPPRLTRRAVLAGIAAGGAGALLAACSDTPVPRTAQPTSEPITLTDNRGKTLVFDRPVTRVVTIPMPAASLLLAVDQGAAHLAGMHNASWAAIRDGVMGEMYPDALRIPHDIATSDFTPNVESILALKPDVVVQWSDSQLVAPLESAGLKVIGLTNHGTQDDVDSWTEIFAAMLGKPGRSREMKSHSDRELGLVTAAASGRAAAGPSILYFNRFSGGLKVAAKGTYNDFYIKLVGGTNPATGPDGVPGGGMAGVDVEQVLRWNPEVILLGNFDDAVPQDLYSNPLWRNVAAVHSGRVYKVPLGGYRWDPPSQESPLMWNWLTDVAFPGGGRSSLRGKVEDDYRFLYDQATTPGQIDAILRLDVNDHSASYLQFHAG